jgi:hypothetical protein
MASKTLPDVVEKEKFVMPTLPSKVQSNMSTNAILENSNIESMIENIVDASVDSLLRFSHAK